LWQRSAAGNVALAQTNLGAMHAFGEGGLAIDHAEAFRLHSLAAGQGLAEGQFTCGACFRFGRGVPRDDVEAVRQWRLAAEQDHALAQGMLAQAFMLGEDITRDYAEALKLARRAAEQRDRVGEFVLGELYRHGLGVAKSAREAVTYHARALVQGDEASKRALCILATEGVPEATAALHRAGIDAPLRAADAAVVAAGRCPLGDLEAQEAACKAWVARPLAAVRAAAEAGDLAAMQELGKRFLLGVLGSPKDETQAVIWCRRAAAGNMARAQFSLASMNAAKGKEGAINNLRAHAANGVPEAAAALRHLRLAP
jgi:hypothetical protein